MCFRLITNLSQVEKAILDNLFRKIDALTKGHFHENWGINSFSKLQDEHLSSLPKRGLSYTGLAKPPNFAKVWQGLLVLMINAHLRIC